MKKLNMKGAKKLTFEEGCNKYIPWFVNAFCEIMNFCNVTGIARIENCFNVWYNVENQK